MFIVSTFIPIKKSFNNKTNTSHSLKPPFLHKGLGENEVSKICVIDKVSQSSPNFVFNINRI